MFFSLMSDSDYGLIVPADVMDGEVIPYGKKFSECISRAKSIREGKKRFKYFVRSVSPTRPTSAIVYFASSKGIISLF